MPFTAPTVSDFIARFPRFAGVVDAAITSALNEAVGRVDDTWAEGDFALGQMLYAAHVLTLDGLGTGAEAQAFAQGMGGYQAMTSGSLSLTRGAGDNTGLGLTSYGLRFRELLRRNFQGIAVANIDV